MRCFHNISMRLLKIQDQLFRLPIFKRKLINLKDHFSQFCLFLLTFSTHAHKHSRLVCQQIYFHLAVIGIERTASSSPISLLVLCCCVCLRCIAKNPSAVGKQTKAPQSINEASNFTFPRLMHTHTHEC